MALSSPPITVAPLDSGYLAAGITASATTITVGSILKDGVTRQGFDTLSGICLIQQGNKTERISYASMSVDATTKVTTLSGVTRGLSLSSTSLNLSAGTGRIWPKGAKISVVQDVSYIQGSVFTSVANTFTAKQTFSAGSRQLPFANTAARDVAFPAPSEGDEAHTTGTGRQIYTSGAWVTTNATANTAMTATAAGTGELGTAADMIAHTGNGDSGAPVVIPSSLAVTSSTGAVNGSVVALNASAKLDTTLLGTGTPAAGKYVDGTGAWTALSVGNIYGDGSDGALNVTSGTTTLDFVSSTILVKNYSSINVSAGATLAFSNPAAAGSIAILKCTGNVTIAGTIDLSAMGAAGGAAITQTSTLTSENKNSAGADATEACNNFDAGTHKGGGGKAASSATVADTSGGATGGNYIAAGTASSAGGTAAAATAGTQVNTTTLAILASSYGMIVAPGPGGGSGGCALSNAGSRTLSYTSGAGARGGGGLVLTGKGTASLTGTINLSGANGANGVSNTLTGSGDYAASASGGAPGGGGLGIGVFEGPITDTLTKTVSPGSAGTAVTNVQTRTAASSSGAVGPSGRILITQGI